MMLLHDTSNMALQEDELVNISKENQAKLKPWKFMILVLVELQNSQSRDVGSWLSSLPFTPPTIITNLLLKHKTDKTSIGKSSKIEILKIHDFGPCRAPKFTVSRRRILTLNFAFKTPARITILLLTRQNHQNTQEKCSFFERWRIDNKTTSKPSNCGRSWGRHFLHTSTCFSMILLHATSKIALQEDELVNISKENKAKLNSWKFMIFVLVELQNSQSRDVGSWLSTLPLKPPPESKFCSWNTRIIKTTQEKCSFFERWRIDNTSTSKP